MRGFPAGDELVQLCRLERSTADGGVRGEDERSQSVREPGLDCIGRERQPIDQAADRVAVRRRVDHQLREDDPLRE